MLDWPPLNGLLWLRLPCCGAEHPSRVEDYADHDLVIAAPAAPHTRPIAPPRNGDGFFLGWVYGTGALERPVTLVEHREGAIPTWRVRSIGDAIEVQRRNYVRADVEMDVVLHLLEGGAPTNAVTLDVSEGGLRCRIDRWALDPGSRNFSIEFPFDGNDHIMRARIAWWGNLDSHGHRVIGVRFVDITPRLADAIRARIFSIQLEQRRRRLV